MLNDMTPVIHRMPISEHDHITIVPLADAHYGSQQFNETLWHTAIRRIQDDPNCYCILVGDLLDTVLPTSVGSVFESTCTPSEQKEWLYNELKPIASKILAAVGGNHERRTKTFDADPLYDILIRLGCENVYRPNICFMQIKMTYHADGREKQRHEFKFAITHGAGGGMYIGSSANRIQNFAMSIDGIHCLVTAHTHKPLSFPAVKLEFTNSKVVRKQFVVAVASSFLEYGGYPVQKLLPPTAQTITEIILTYTAEKQNIRVLQ